MRLYDRAATAKPDAPRAVTAKPPHPVVALLSRLLEKLPESLGGPHRPTASERASAALTKLTGSKFSQVDFGNEPCLTASLITSAELRAMQALQGNGIGLFCPPNHDPDHPDSKAVVRLVDLDIPRLESLADNESGSVQDMKGGFESANELHINPRAAEPNAHPGGLRF